MKRLSILLLTVLLLSPPAGAGSRDQMNFQGILRDSSGNLINDSTHDFRLEIYDDPAAGSQLWTEDQLNVTITDGVFNIELGEVTPLDPADFTGDVFLQVTIGTDDVFGDGETLTPRQQILSAAYALNAHTLDGSDSTAFAAASHNHDTRYYTETELDTGQLDNRYYRENEHINASAGAADAGKPVVLDAAGHIDASMLNDADVDHGSLGGLADNDHAQYVLDAGDTMTGTLNFSGAWGTTTPYTPAVDILNTSALSGAGSFIRTQTASGWSTMFGTVQDTYWHAFTDASGAFQWGYDGTSLITDDDLRIGNASGVDNDFLYFDAGFESLAWDNAQARFEFSDDLNCSGVLNAGTTSLYGYNSIGSTSPTSGDVSSTCDLGVGCDLEVQSQLYVADIRDRVAGAAPGATTMSLRADGSMAFYFDQDQNCFGFSEGFLWYRDNSQLIMRLGFPGSSDNLDVDGFVNANAFDIAETFIRGEAMEPGDLVRINPDRSNAVLLTTGADDGLAIGVISQQPGFTLGRTLFNVEDLVKWGDDMVERFLELEPVIHEQYGKTHPGIQGDAESMRQHALGVFAMEHLVPVALAGRTPVKVDAAFGAIRAGDLLAASPVPGVAMKASQAGPTIGMAMEDWTDGRGKVLAFVYRGDYTPDPRPRVAALEEATEELAEITPDPETGVQTVAGNLRVVLDRDANDASSFSVFRDGELGLRQELFRLDEAGDLHLKGALRPAALDLAEYHPVSEPVEAGDVLVMDPQHPEAMRRCADGNDPTVVGIVSSKPGVILGADLERIANLEPALAARIDDARLRGDREEEDQAWAILRRRFEASHAAIALSGTVPCKVDAAYGPIRRGDLLVASPTPGHAMRTDAPAPGTIIAKALEDWNTGQGRVRVLVMLR